MECENIQHFIKFCINRHLMRRHAVLIFQPSTDAQKLDSKIKPNA
jgi:hypothetical protein